MVIFTSNKSLNLTIEHFNSALKNLNTILNKVSFEVAPDRCNLVIFTGRRYISV